jgi:hypothetical protein
MNKEYIKDIATALLLAVSIAILGLLLVGLGY